MNKRVKLYLGNNMDSIKKLPDNSIDSIVCDPPYAIKFMNRAWDYELPSVEFWREALRVLKPGGHLLAFGGTRTYHRLVCGIEDAGFEIRDQVMWIYGSGFPKSHNIGKAVDKINGVEIEKWPTIDMYNNSEIGNISKNQRCGVCEKPFSSGNPCKCDRRHKCDNEYEGWGTALKPANEPICVARKPISEKTIAENVLKWGTGGINIDGCRIEIGGKDMEDRISQEKSRRVDNNHNEGFLGKSKIEPNMKVSEGRFPANIIFDETAAELLDEQSGISKPKKERTGRKGGTNESDFSKAISADPDFIGHWPGDNGGGASRFFYCAKVSKAERNMGLDGFEDKITPVNTGINSTDENGNKVRNDGSIIPPLVAKNTHCTVKPITLMSYLIKLVTPVNGIILDPFMGSGSTGIAAQLNGFRFCGMEMSEEYFKIAEARIENYELYRKFLDKRPKNPKK